MSSENNFKLIANMYHDKEYENKGKLYEKLKCILDEDTPDVQKLRQILPEEENALFYTLLFQDAESGDLKAQKKLADYYFYGYQNSNGQFDIPQDYTLAIVWYTKAAQGGNAEAQCQLGMCYEYGLGTERDLKKAVFWLTKAEKQGNILALEEAPYARRLSASLRLSHATEEELSYKEYNNDLAKQIKPALSSTYNQLIPYLQELYTALDATNHNIGILLNNMESQKEVSKREHSKKKNFWEDTVGWYLFISFFICAGVLLCSFVTTLFELPFPKLIMLVLYLIMFIPGNIASLLSTGHFAINPETMAHVLLPGLHRKEWLDACLASTLMLGIVYVLWFILIICLLPKKDKKKTTEEETKEDSFSAMLHQTTVSPQHKFTKPDWELFILYDLAKYLDIQNLETARHHLDHLREKSLSFNPEWNTPKFEAFSLEIEPKESSVKMNRKQKKSQNINVEIQKPNRGYLLELALQEAAKVYPVGRRADTIQLERLNTLFKNGVCGIYKAEIHEDLANFFEEEYLSILKKRAQYDDAEAMCELYGHYRFTDKFEARMWGDKALALRYPRMMYFAASESTFFDLSPQQARDYAMYAKEKNVDGADILLELLGLRQKEKERRKKIAEDYKRRQQQVYDASRYDEVWESIGNAYNEHLAKHDVPNLPAFIYDSNGKELKRLWSSGDHVEYEDENGNRVVIRNTSISGTTATTNEGSFHWYGS